MKEKGFALIFVLIGALVVAVFITAGYVYFRNFSQAPRLSKKPLNEPNYLAYLKSEVMEHNEKGFVKNKYTLMVVKEDGSEKKALFSYVRDGINANQSSASLGFVYGKDNIMLQRIKGDIGNEDEDVKFFNKNGEDSLALSFYEKHKDKGIGLESYEFAASDHPAVSADNKSIAYIKSPVSEQQKSIAVFNLAANNEKIYKINGDYRETGFILHFSPDNKKLYVCACAGFYWRGPSLGTWEIDLETNLVKPLDYINNLKIKSVYFRYDNNSAYGAMYEDYDNPEVGPIEGGPLQRSKILYRINLYTQQVTQINFNSYFDSVDISRTGNYGVYTYSLKKGTFVKNLKTGEEFRIDVSKIGSWADNDKLFVLIGDPEKTNAIELYIYNPADKTKILVDTIQVEEGRFIKSTIEPIGWVH